MKYYKINIKSIYRVNDNNKAIGHANGQYVPNGKYYFDRIGKEEIIENAPIFNYFHLQSFGEKKDWEWRKQDVHGFIGEYPTGGNWYISDDFKLLLENFFIAPKYHFYETRLLYKGEKYKYWIFQFGVDYEKNIIYPRSEFYYIEKNTKIEFKVDNYDEYLKIRSKILIESDYEKEIYCKSLCYTSNFDWVTGYKRSENLCSEKLKTAIEQMGLEGILFSEVEYEIEIENNL